VRVARDLAHRLHDSGKMDDGAYVNFLHSNKLLPPELLNDDGDPIANAAVVGNEMWAAEKFPEDYRAGDWIREDALAKAVEARKNDPIAKEKAEMKVSESFARKWREDEERRLASTTRQGREKLERAEHEADLQKAEETVQRFAALPAEDREAIMQFQDQPLGAILTDAVKETNGQ
jgi:hypothetical protein